jgi:quercetin dioxygenase-like cupin family protein
MDGTATHLRKSLANRIVRYGDLVPCFNAFIDSRTPGSDRKENFTIIGPGVSESKDQHVHIAEPHGFNIGGARQPPGCTNSQHSHETAEVFYVHSGTWRFDLGEHGRDAQSVLESGDLISIPTHVFRGFRNIGTDTGFLFAVLGGDDPGRVLWAPQVFDMAKDYGLVLLEDGMLIDTGNGEAIPSGKRPMPVTSRADVSALKHFDQAALEACIVRARSISPDKRVSTHPLIGDGALDWPHGFTIVETVLRRGEALSAHVSDNSHVLFVQSGKINLEIEGYETDTAGPGDTVTIPAGLLRAVSACGDETAVFIAVEGNGDGKSSGASG